MRIDRLTIIRHRGRLALVASEVVLAGVVAVPRAATGLVVAGAGASLLWRPELVVLACFLAIEELPASSPFLADAPRVLTAGTELYRLRLAGLPLPFVVVGCAAVVMVLRRPAARTAPRVAIWDGPVPVVLAALSGWCAVLSVLQDEDRQVAGVAVHALAAAGPWLAALAAFVVGAVLARERRGVLAAAVGGVLVAKAVLGVAMEVLTGGVTVDSQRFVIFYDAALPTLAGAVLIGRLFADRRTWPGERLVAAAAAVVVLLSFRRAVWLLVAVAFVAVPLVRRRADMARRAVAVSACALALALLTPAGARAPIASRVLEAVGVVQGRSSGVNTSKLHLDDVTRGFSLASDALWGGIGVRAAQPAGLAVPAAPDQYLYVHNELLQTWLRFGLPGLALLCVLLGHLFWRSVRLLGSRDRLDVLDAAGAVFAGGVAVPAMTAAFLSTTWRFPVLLGLAAAVVEHAHERRVQAERAQEAVHRPVVDGPAVAGPVASRA